MMLASDIQIREAVLREIRWDPRINVTVCGGTVKLSGTVDSPKRCLDAHEGAERADGVFKVVNEIEVTQAEASRATAENIQLAIAEALKERAELEARRIGVTLKDGRVTLTGPVQSRDEERAIINAAGRLPGILDVNDRLSIEN
jgi:osmotically-inducible protein OsmY